MTHIVGIDLGTTNSAVAILKRGKVECILIEGSALVPSIVSYRPDGTLLVGRQAKARLLVEPESTIAACKRSMGDRAKRYRIKPDRLLTPVDVSRDILKRLVSAAEQELGGPISGAVITVPAYFTEAQKKDTKQAAEEAGIRVLRLLAEPTAAAIAYGMNRESDQTLLVYDLGGGTFDVSILQMQGKAFIVRAVGGDGRLGGEDFDQAIMNWADAQFTAKEKIALKDAPPEQAQLSQQRLKEASETAKIKLSEAPVANIRVPDYMPGYALDVELTREEYNRLIAPFIERTIAKVRSTLADARLTPDDIDRVILVGGSTKNTAVQEAVRQELKEPWKADHVDEVVAYGAAIVAADMLLPQPPSPVQDLTAYSLGIDVRGDFDRLEFLPIIPRQSEYPCRSGHLGSTRPMQPLVAMRVFRGEDIVPENNTYLGELTLRISRPRPDIILIGVIFELDSNGIIHFRGVEFPDTEEIPEIADYALMNNGALHLEATDRIVASGRANIAETHIQM